MRKLLLVATATIAASAGLARADIVVSMNDNHTVLDDQANLAAPKVVKPDTVDIIDVSSYPPRIVDTIEAPGSVIGPPLAVWVAKDESWAIITAATKADPAGKFGISADDRVSVIDLTAKPPRITQTISAGAGATVVRVSPDGKLAMVANRAAGTVSVFTVADKHLTAAGQVDLGATSMPNSVVILPDGKTALVSLGGDNKVDVLHIDGTKITVDPRPITTGMGPYTMDMNAAGTLAAAGNMGRGDGDADSVALIELTQAPFRTVSVTGVTSGPEPLKFSPDGKFLAVGTAEGTTKLASSPFFHDHGNLHIFAVDGDKLQEVATAPVGRWLEGVVWSRDGKTVMIQNDFEHTISVFRFDGKTLTPGETLKPSGGPVSFGTAWP